MKYKRTSLVERWALDGDVRKENVSQCFFCKNNLPKGKCVAFPDGIPDEITKNFFIHNKPYEGDNGIQFEAKKEEYKNVKFEPMRKKSLDELMKQTKLKKDKE